MGLGRRGEWASALVYGANKHVGPRGTEPGHWEHAVMAESNLQLDEANSVFGRVEYVKKSGEELAGESWGAVVPADPAAGPCGWQVVRG